MQSAVNSGLKQKTLEYYKREIIQVYGFKHLITMTHLENAGLIKIQVNALFKILIRKLYLMSICYRQTQEVMLFVAVY